MQAMENESIRAWSSASCPGADLDTLRRFIMEEQGDLGGGKDRSGHEDIYYTGFLVRLLRGLGPELIPEYEEKVGRSGSYALSRVENARRMSDLFSIALVLGALTDRTVIADNRAILLSHLKGLKTNDGGYAVAPGTEFATIYDTFTAVHLRILLDGRMRLTNMQKDGIRDFILARVAPDGGMSSRLGRERSGIIPTSAALATLKDIGMLDEDVKNRAVRRILALFDTDSGGFRSSEGTPYPDLLSTRMAVSSLAYIGTLGEFKPEGLERMMGFVSRCRSGGHYSSVPVDQTTDLEYTYYGASTQAILSLALKIC